MEHDVLEISNRRSKSIKDDEGTGRGRKRVSRACDRCRIKKDKCDALKPRCSPCIANNQPCSYDPSAKKRGLPEGYVRGLEKLWALSIQKIDGLELTVRHIAAREEVSGVWTDESENLHTIWKESSVLHDLESLLSRTEQDQGQGLKRKRDEIESATPADTSALKAEYQITSVLANTPPRRLPDLPAELPLPDTATSLLDHYFTYTHCWFPIVEKHHLLRTCYENSRRQRATPDADLAALWAVLAYTARQLGHDAESMRSYARSLVPDEKGPFELGHVQALLLLSLLDVGCGEWKKAWVLVGSASRIALSLGLETNTSEKRAVAVIQACCILDTLIAGHLMKRPHLRRSDIQDLGSLDEDGSEEWDPWRPSRTSFEAPLEPAFTISCFNRLVGVVTIMNDALTCDLPSGEDRRMFFADRSNLLKQLHTKQPARVAKQIPESPHQVYLQLFHLSASIVLLRESFEGGAPSDSLARLACDVLVLLTKYAQTSALERHVIPPILENSVRSACYAAIASKPSFGTLGLPSYHDFAFRMTENVSEFSSTWSVFTSLSPLWQTELGTNISTASSLRISGANGVHQRPTDWLDSDDFRMALQSTQWDLKTQSSDLDGMSFRALQPVHEPDAWCAPRSSTSMADAIDPGLGSLTSQPTNNTEAQDKALRNSMDQAMSGMGSNTPAGLAMPVTTEPSPSFYEDEVDAIFHDLLYLDTTEWTNNREQGLRDFGFADDMTFQAFCNDPERLISNGAVGPAFNLTSDAWPPPGLFPGHFDTPDSQLEASRILQSLSGDHDSSAVQERDNWWTQ